MRSILTNQESVLGCGLIISRRKEIAWARNTLVFRLVPEQLPYSAAVF